MPAPASRLALTQLVRAALFLLTALLVPEREVDFVLSAAATLQQSQNSKQDAAFLSPLGTQNPEDLRALHEQDDLLWCTNVEEESKEPKEPSGPCATPPSEHPNDWLVERTTTPLALTGQVEASTPKSEHRLHSRGPPLSS